MGILKGIQLLPNKLNHKLVTAFCLMSLLPLLAGVYIASLFIKFPFVISLTNIATVSLILLFSLTLSLLGFEVTKMMVTPIVDVAAQAKKIASGQLDEDIQAGGCEEIEDLSRSLQEISRNARELLHKVDTLSQKDKLTGLYNGVYLRERLDEEIARAIHYQRPCSLVYILLDGFQAHAERVGEEAASAMQLQLANVLFANTSEFDRAARIARGEFALILPDKNKKKSIEIAAKISAAISSLEYVRSQAHPEGAITPLIGISENPLDGVTGAELYAKAAARARLSKTKEYHIEAFA